MEKPWSLYNKTEKLRVDDLRSEHVKIILLAIPNSRMSDWYACQEGDVHWQPISAIPEFYEDVRQLKGNALTGEAEVIAPKIETPPETEQKQSPRRPLFEDAPDDLLLTEPGLVVDSAQTKERRTARRYPRKLMFKVIQGGQSFQSETSDVSMNGVALAAQLPSWVPKTFRAELTMNKTNVRVLCTRVDDSKLKLMDADSWDVIRQWLVNW